MYFLSNRQIYKNESYVNIKIDLKTVKLLTFIEGFQQKNARQNDKRFLNKQTKLSISSNCYI